MYVAVHGTARVLRPSATYLALKFIPVQPAGCLLLCRFTAVASLYNGTRIGWLQAQEGEALHHARAWLAVTHGRPRLA